MQISPEVMQRLYKVLYSDTPEDPLALGVKDMVETRGYDPNLVNDFIDAENVIADADNNYNFDYNYDITPAKKSAAVFDLADKGYDLNLINNDKDLLDAGLNSEGIFKDNDIYSFIDFPSDIVDETAPAYSSAQLFENLSDEDILEILKNGYAPIKFNI